MRIGIICEGSTDFPVLQAITAEILRSRDPTFSLLQPDFDGLDRPRGARRPATGWQAVRAFLQSGSAWLSTLDLIIVQVDASVRHIDSMAKVLGSDELDALCDHVKGWMGVVPPSVVITLPREELETWLVAAHTHRKDPERISDPVEVLVNRGLLEARKSNKRRSAPDKRASRYAELARALGSLVSDARWLRSVPELERFVSKLRAHHRRR